MKSDRIKAIPNCASDKAIAKFLLMNGFKGLNVQWSFAFFLFRLIKREPIAPVII